MQDKLFEKALEELLESVQICIQIMESACCLSVYEDAEADYNASKEAIEELRKIDERF